MKGNFFFDKLYHLNLYYWTNNLKKTYTYLVKSSEVVWKNIFEEKSAILFLYS